jgi:hypothetical protein
MRLTLLVLPLICLAGCTSDTARTTTPSSLPAATTVPSTPSTPSTASASAAVAPVAAAVKPAPAPVTVDLTKWTGPSESAANFGYDENLSRLFLLSNGAITLPLKLAGDGDYEIVINAACDEAMMIKAKFSVAIDEQIIAAEVTETATEPKEYVVKAPGLKAGAHKLSIAFLNDMYKEGEYDLNLYVHGVALRPAK